MRLFSFRIIIVITIFFVVSIVSYFVLDVFDSYLSKEMYKHVKTDIVSVLNILQKQYSHPDTVDGKQEVHAILADLNENPHIRNTFLINSKDSLVVFPDMDSLAKDKASILKISELDENVFLQDFTNDTNPYLRAYIRLHNSPKCYKCHSPDKQYLGLLVFDLMLTETHENISLLRFFSFVYTVIIVVIILVSIFLVHYRFVKRSLHNFHKSIDIINQGNLDERLSIPDSRELGKLGQSFNAMLDTFQKTQKELQIYNQKEIENKDKMATIGEMTARLAHEIRNPITGIANASEILIEHAGEDVNKPVLEEIRRQAKRVNIAISNMLRFSKPTDITLKENDMNQVIRNLVFFVKNQTHQKKVEFKLELQEDIPLFQFDHEKIENVLLNLVLNAIQSIPKAGTVIFKTNFSSENKEVTITVEDTGAGIPKDILNDIFNPFFTTRTEGSGLGLAISKEMIEKHKGRIWAESKTSQGSRFFIVLPVQ